MSRLTFTDRRRAMLAQRPQSLEAMEPRSMITESLGIMMLGIGIPSALAGQALQADNGGRPSSPAPLPSARQPYSDLTIPFRSRKTTGGAAVATPIPVTVSYQAPARPANDWLTLIRPVTSRAAEDQVSSLTPPKPKLGANSGGQTSTRGGAGGGTASKIAPFRVAATRPMNTDASGGPSAAASVSLGGILTPSVTGAGTEKSSTASVGGGNQSPVSMSMSPVAQVPTADPGILGGPQSFGAASSFPYFPLYTLDYNDGSVLFPGTYQYATPGGNVDLRAQVRDTTVSTYSWAFNGTTVSGATTYRYQFQWNTFPTSASINTVTLTVTNNLGQQESQTYSFLLPALAGAAGTGTATWPESLAPNTVLPNAPSFASHNVSVDANTGSLDTMISLPAYNPNLAPLALTYDSLTADPRPIIVEHHVIDPSLAIPSQVSGQLTFNSVAGTTYYYNTSQFIPGDIQQIALQADATGLSTGRFSYSLSIGDVRGSTTTTNVNGTATVLKYSGNAFGSGWTLQGLEQITSASGGVILDLGMSGRSEWFTGTSGTLTSPAGEFSTLVKNGGGTYTQTLTDGTVYQFNAAGYETSVADRNGLLTTFAYDGSNKLSTITDPYGKVTTFAYDGSNKLSTITDPANRVTTVTHSGNNLTGVTLPDTKGWTYAYDGSGRLTQVTDPRSKTVTVAYDSAERASTVTRPDTTAETFAAYQERGWTNSGTSGSPAAATLLAEARASYTDANGHTTDIRPDWNGLGLIGQATDADGNVATRNRDSNGLATVVIDRLNQISRYAYDAHGNITKLTYPDLNTEQFTYNGFAEPTTHTDPLSHTTTLTYDGNGNLTVVKDPVGNLTTMTYTANGRVATVKDARSNVTSYQYDSQDRLTTATYPDGATKLAAYDTKGNPTTLTDERGNVSTASYDAMNRPTGMTDALGNRTT